MDPVVSAVKLIHSAANVDHKYACRRLNALSQLLWTGLDYSVANDAFAYSMDFEKTGVRFESLNAFKDQLKSDSGMEDVGQIFEYSR